LPGTYPFKKPGGISEVCVEQENALDSNFGNFLPQNIEMIPWDISITQNEGDGKRLAQEAVAAGVDLVAACGGAGTVAEVASGLIGSQVPLAILPGGTANVLAVELNLPLDLTAACQLLCGEYALRPVDMGHAGNRPFILRVGLGLEAAMVEGANPDLKFRVGTLAYAFSILQALQDPGVARYEMVLDGEMVHSEGVTCLIANTANMGILGSTLSPKTSVSDGLLDVFVVQKADLSSILSLAASVVTGPENEQAMQHWQARAITGVSDPVQTLQADGEITGQSPVQAQIIPNAVQIVVPKPPEA
jgi:YegS/Rv2252/BmrU family lipid kinase